MRCPQKRNSRTFVVAIYHDLDLADQIVELFFHFSSGLDAFTYLQSKTDT